MLLALLVDRMVKPQHLDLIDELAPGACLRLLGPPVIDRRDADQGRAGRLLRKGLRQCDAPCVASRSAQLEACLVKYRLHRFEQRYTLFWRDGQLGGGQQRGAVAGRCDMHQLGQPDGFFR